MEATGMAKEEKKDNDSDQNGNIGAKKVKKKRGGIEKSVTKEKEDNSSNNTKCKYMYIISFFQNN